MKIEMNNIHKSFGINHVLKGVSIKVDDGDILGLLGENGAGKSTLMNILGGVLKQDSGEIKINGEVKNFNTPFESLKSGIAFIHQELNLINDLTIYENMFIGREIKNKYHILNKKEMIEKTKEIFGQMELHLEPTMMVRDLDASYKQFVEIAKALMMNASLIIMDEPTTSLTEPEIKSVFNMMNKLKEKGVSMIFISHKLNEVLQICTKYTVLRDGALIVNEDIEGATIPKITKYMVGHEIINEKKTREINSKDKVLELIALTNEKHFKDINLVLNRGEILGVTGLLGDGRSELFQSVFGDNTNYKGEIKLEGKTVKIKSTIDAMKHQIAYLPRNRKENGIVKDMTIVENGSLTILDKHKKSIFIDHKKINELFNKQRKNLSIKMEDNNNLITSLSGGNQQKVVLAKWLSANPKVLILDNPTQGVDVGAKEEIYDIIFGLANSGVGIIVLSSEAQEIIRLCDRTIVMYHGEIKTTLDSSEMSEHKIMHYATGGTDGTYENISN